jgi:DNA polymerase V
LETEANIEIKSEVGELFKFENGVRVNIPFFSSPVKAGFPSPAEDYVESRIDLNADLIPNPDSTFYSRVEGDSMEPLIHVGSMLVIDRAQETLSGDIVLALINGEFCMKRLYLSTNGIKLLSENPAYKAIVITGEMDFRIWGKIIHVIQSF